MNALTRSLVISGSTAILAACGGCGGGSESTAPPPTVTPSPTPSVTVDADIKQLIFSWEEVAGATYYQLLENPDGSSGFVQVGADIPAGTLTVSMQISVHLHDFNRALYIIRSCDAASCTDLPEVSARDAMLSSIGFFKASDTSEFAHFGVSVSLSADGNTMAVGNRDNQDLGTDSVYIFRHDGTTWSQQASFTTSGSEATFSLSADGNTLAMGSRYDHSGATGINGDQNDDSIPNSGAAYVYRFDGADWYQEAYLKASNTGSGDYFGGAVSLSADGNTLVVGASGEDSSATGINGDQNDDSIPNSGAAYVFGFDGLAWSQQGYIKASNTEANDLFGSKTFLSGDGDTMVVGAIGEDSSATGINGDQADNSAAAGGTGESTGAMYVFRFDGADWYQEAYVKASTIDPPDGTGQDVFGSSVTLSADGNTLVVGARNEDSNATGVGGDQNDNSFHNSGAAYVFRFDGTDWSQQAYVKASNSGWNDEFGFSVALSADGNMLAVGAKFEESAATGVGGDQNDDSDAGSGAVYVFRFDGLNWVQASYVKASSSVTRVLGRQLRFGGAVALSANGSTMAIGATGDDSGATGVGGDQDDDTATYSGAVFMY